MIKKFAFVFPGQGSQVIGMGKNLYSESPTARKIFEEVDDILQENLSALMFEGSEENLRLTQNAQPALMTVSMALLRVLREEMDFSSVAFVAGHSLGEYSALCAADTFSLKDTALLLKQRGEFMHDACHGTPGGMGAVLGLEATALAKLLEEGPHPEACFIANDNCPGQLVISGPLAALDDVIGYLQTHGAKRVLKLPVSGAFHSPLMAQAQASMEKAFLSIQGIDPKIPFVANETALPIQDYPRIQQSLIHQITSPVHWRETILFLEYAGVTDLIEVGSGKVLTNLALRTAPALNARTINELSDIHIFLKELTLPSAS